MISRSFINTNILLLLLFFIYFFLLPKEMQTKHATSQSADNVLHVDNGIYTFKQNIQL